MPSFVIVLSLLACSWLGTSMAQLYTQPEQIHLSYGADETEMRVTWVTLNSTEDAHVRYRSHGFPPLRMPAKRVTFTDGGLENRTIFVYKATMVNLHPGRMYVYRVGSPFAGWSELFFFTAMQSGTDWSPRFAVYGDMGNVNAQSIPRLQDETERGHFDAILHVGDFAYDMHTWDVITHPCLNYGDILASRQYEHGQDGGRVGDAFMNQIQPIAAYVPYMTTVGNHEQAYNFSHYVNRFSMPGGSGDGMFYSYNVGPVHFVSFSSEYYYFVNYGWEQIAVQYKWLDNDLKEASSAENRKKRPWIITMCHRPMYCSNSDEPLQHCGNLENTIRVGLPLLHAYSPEELLYRYGVDLHITAHEHSYERSWPVYNNIVCNGSLAEPYKNPTAPVHIVTGSAGCLERVDPFTGTQPPYSAMRSDDYGYSRMTVYNATHLYLEQVSDDKGGEVIDRMMLVKEHHGPHDCEPSKIRLEDVTM